MAYRFDEAVPFPVFDREAMFEASKGKTRLRLQALGLGDADLSRRGLHPELGVVTLGQHLATWVAHDLGHLVQVARAMARRYTDAVGPWRAYLSVLGDRAK